MTPPTPATTKAAAAARGGSSTMRDVTMNSFYASRTFTQKTRKNMYIGACRSQVGCWGFMGIVRAHATRAARPPAAELPAARAVQEGHLAAPTPCTRREDRARSVSIGLYEPHTGSHSRGSRGSYTAGCGGWRCRRRTRRVRAICARSAGAVTHPRATATRWGPMGSQWGATHIDYGRT